MVCIQRWGISFVHRMGDDNGTHHMQSANRFKTSWQKNFIGKPKHEQKQNIDFSSEYFVFPLFFFFFSLNTSIWNVSEWVFECSSNHAAIEFYIDCRRIFKWQYGTEYTVELKPQFISKKQMGNSHPANNQPTSQPRLNKNHLWPKRGQCLCRFAGTRHGHSVYTTLTLGRAIPLKEVREETFNIMCRMFMPPHPTIHMPRCRGNNHQFYSFGHAHRHHNNYTLNCWYILVFGVLRIAINIFLTRIIFNCNSDHVT